MHKVWDERRCKVFFPTIKGIDQEGNEESASMCDGRGSMTLYMKLELRDPIAGDMLPG